MLECIKIRGFKTLMKSIACTKHSNLFLNFLSTSAPVHGLVVFGNGGGFFLMSFYTLSVHVRLRNLHNPHHTGHIQVIW